VRKVGLANVINKYRRRFERELRDCRGMANRVKNLQKKWTKTGGVLDNALKTYEPLKNGSPESRSAFRGYFTARAHFERESAQARARFEVQLAQARARFEVESTQILELVLTQIAQAQK
jgi:hypothetical protein